MEDTAIAEKMVELAQALGGVSGKKQYGYLPKKVKALVDAITDALASQPDVAACYQAWNDLRDELERFYKDKYRVMFDGVACWPQLKYCNECMANCGCNWVGAPYTDLFHQVYTDIREQASCYAFLVCNTGMAAWQENRGYIIENYKVDGILGNITRSCKPMIGKMPVSNRILSAKYGIPATTFDGDQSDPRVLSKAQFETRLQGLVEIMAENKKEREEKKND